MRRAPGRLRAVGFVVLSAAVFVVVNSQVVYAATSSGATSGTGDLLAPLDITSSEGVPLDGYDLASAGGSIVAFKTQALAFALSGLFTLIRLLVGLAGWAIEVAFRFPLLKLLITPAQKTADSYTRLAVDTLGLKGLLLSWAFVFSAFLIVRGRLARGLGEIVLTLLIGALAASVFVRPDYLLGADGPLGQAQQMAGQVAQQSVASYDWGGKIASTDPCASLSGNAELTCLQEEGSAPVSAAQVARPLQDALTNALVVKPYMLLEYGRILDPAKTADRAAYALHLKWVTGGYKAATAGASQEAKDTCKKIIGPAKTYCERGIDGTPGKSSDSLPALTPGGELLDAQNALVTDDDREFDAFLTDLKKAGPVGKACAAYAQTPTWWRLGGAGLLLVAALFLCGMFLSSAMMLLATQAVCAGAAAAGGITFVTGMLPGPARQSVWKWLSLWGIALATMVGVCAFVPFAGIAMDATLTHGPQLEVERLLLLDALAVAGAAGHRRLLTAISAFSRRMALRMRYAKVGGTHLPGDSSDFGAALALHSPHLLGGALSAAGGGRVLGGGGRLGLLGTRHRLLGALASAVDGAGVPVDTGRLLAEAGAEAGRGLAPLTAAAAAAGAGVSLGSRGAYSLLVGRRPDRDQIAKWQKPTGTDGAAVAAGAGGRGTAGRAGQVSAPVVRRGPADRYRDDQGRIIDRTTGEILHDQNADRPLLSTRAHNRLVRYRGYRLLNRGGRAAYATTAGLPENVRRLRSGESHFTQDVRRQVRVWANTVREDRRAWGDTGRHIVRAARDAGDHGGTGPFTTRRLTGNGPATAAAPGTAPTGTDRSAPTGRTDGGGARGGSSGGGRLPDGPAATRGSTGQATGGSGQGGGSGTARRGPGATAAHWWTTPSGPPQPSDQRLARLLAPPPHPRPESAANGEDMTGGEDGEGS
ncbi:hypothetical protein [Streptomyces mangrovisoli]|uniref:Uncharacterized protein n=1 Tax=Streptomyces mangrovisoli TaxID=1428628 RepID=A0A1J4NRM6_9ACTN|nr:hypothetical protein [Streptomyces mangrovisoli]OIJ64968.1 hypothetical protein WN71_026145 [Streptomyces mangrovisoli]